MDTATALTTLNIEIDDGDNFTFTADEKNRAITRAWNDKYVVQESYDSSLTYDNTVQQYTLPTSMRDVISVGQDPNNDSFETELPSTAWTVKAGKLHIDSAYRTYLTTGKTLYLWGWKKLTTSDSITDELLQEYVLDLARYNTLHQLQSKGVNRFLKNDTTISELLNTSREAKARVDEYRSQHRAVSQEV